jgi:hypothetical protein
VTLKGKPPAEVQADLVECIYDALVPKAQGHLFNEKP